MAWQDVFPVSSPRIAAEEERELLLVAQARAGADWALTALVARYQPPVTRYLTRLTGDADLARALAERVFVRMERRLHGPEGGRHLRLWLLRASTEAGLDALRRPKGDKPAARLTAPPRPAGLLAGAGGSAAMRRLKVRLGALAQAAEQTRRQVRRLIWSTTPDAVVAPDFDAAASGARRPMPPPAVEEAAGIEHDPIEQNPREALRYRMVRAVLAELPYGDAQCVALHLVAGLNQAEVAAALGLTNTATRRRVVQGLHLFAQRFNAAAASLGIAPEALVAEEPHPLEPGVGGYVAMQEQPTGNMTSPYAAGAQPAEVEIAPPVESWEAHPFGQEETPPHVVEADAEPLAGTVAGPAADNAPPVVVESLPADAKTPVAPTAEPAPATDPMRDEMAGAAGEDASAAGGQAATREAQLAGIDDITLPAAQLAEAAAEGVAQHESPAPPAEGAPGGLALAAQSVEADDVGAGAPPDGSGIQLDGAEARPHADAPSPTAPDLPESSPDTVDGVAPLPVAQAARLVPVVTPRASAAMAAAQAPEARLVPVLTPRARQRVDTIPRRRRGGRDTPVLLRDAGVGGLSGD